MSERPHDVFISYSHEDRTWVRDRLLPQLEGAGLRVIIDYRDFEVGVPSLVNMERAVDGSSHTLLVLSPTWVESQWTEFESLLAGTADPAGRRRKLIPLMLSPCELPPRVAMLTYADLTDPATRDEQMARVLRGIGAKSHIFICYKRFADPDQRLARHLHETLTAQGHEVFIDLGMRSGDPWLQEIDRNLKASDYLVVLLSRDSADSEMVQHELRRAYEYRKAHGHPRTLPVRVGYEGMLPYTIDAFLDPVQYVVWQSEADDERVSDEILAALQGRPPRRAPVQFAPGTEAPTLSEDGRPIADGQALHPPLPQFDPRFLDELEAPGGTLKLRDQFYVRRDADAQLERQIVRPGTITTIRAARQTGKSSLLVRGVHHARQQGASVVNFDLQRVDRDYLDGPDLFLRYLAEYIVRKLRLDADEVERSWRDSLGPQDKITYLMEDYVLPESEGAIVLAMDEIDRLLGTPFYSDFFALLRSWHNSAAYDELWQKLSIVMVISTEPYLLIADMNQSPFNVGLKLYLTDFDEAQVGELNRRHSSPVGRRDLSQLLELLGGHPYLTRKALYTLVVDRMDWTGFCAAAPTDQGPFSDHLRRYHWMLRQEPHLGEALKQVIRQHECVDDLAFYRLLRAGLVKGSGDKCRPRCGLYKVYFRDKL